MDTLDGIIGLSLLAYHFVQNSVTMIEGTVISLLEADGTIVGVEYREKSSNAKKVLFFPDSLIFTTLANNQFRCYLSQCSL